MISKQEVEHIAKLARLQLTKKETEKMQKDMSAILDYFNVLKQAPVPQTHADRAQTNADKNGVSAGQRQVRASQRFLQSKNGRKDVAVQKPASLANNLVQAAPDKKDGYVKVKAIL